MIDSAAFDFKMTDHGEEFDPQNRNFILSRSGSKFEQRSVTGFDWPSLHYTIKEALTLRASGVVSHESCPEQLATSISESVQRTEYLEPCTMILLQLREMAVASVSPRRLYVSAWFFMRTDTDATKAEESIIRIFPPKSLSFVIQEMLTSVIMRWRIRKSKSSLDLACASVERFLLTSQPCATLFTEVANQSPNTAMDLISRIPRSEVRHLVGDWAILKLAQHSVFTLKDKYLDYIRIISVLEMFELHHDQWPFFTYKALLGLATSLGRRSKGVVSKLLGFIEKTQLTDMDKLSLHLLSGSQDPKYSHQFKLVWEIGNCQRDVLSETKLQKFLVEYDDGSVSAGRLVEALLRRCGDNSCYNVAWRIASVAKSIDEHCIEWALAIFCRAFFQFHHDGEKRQADKWFGRVTWCFVSNILSTGAYSSGLAMHCAAERGDIHLCWEWLCEKRKARHNNVCSHFTSSIIKAASNCKLAEDHMDRVIEAYTVTSKRELSHFIFEPLYHVWQDTEYSRRTYMNFWSDVLIDLTRTIEIMEKRTYNPKDKLKTLSKFQGALDREFYGKRRPSFQELNASAPSFVPKV